MKIDNFALAQFQACPAKYDLRIRQGYVPTRRSPALRFGGALHEGLAAWYKGFGLEASLEAIAVAWDNSWDLDDYRTLEKCLQTMIEYTKQYPYEHFQALGMPDAPIIEKPFTFDTGTFCGCLICGQFNQDSHEDTCGNCKSPLEPIEYGGILDALIDHSGGVLYVMDHKTTSVMGASYFDQFKPDNQMTGYIWGGMQLSGGRVAGALVNGIGIYAKGKTKFERKITTRNEQDITEWLAHLRYHCTAIMKFEQQGIWPFQTINCVTKYGRCDYFDVHLLSRADDRSTMLSQSYRVDRWDYERRDGEISA